jgi:Protein of unknown function (DUF1189)
MDFSHPNSTPPRITYFEWLTQSVDSRFYAKLLHIPPKVIRYYFILTVILAVAVSSIAMAMYSYQMFAEAADVFREHFSPMEFRDGKLTVLGPVPITYSSENFQIIVDPDDNTRKLDPLFSQGLVLLDDHLTIYFAGKGSQAFTYEKLGLVQFSLDADVIEESRLIGAMLVLLLSGGLRVIGWLIAKVFQVLVGASVIGLITEIKHIKVSPEIRLALAATALVPSIFLHFLQVVFQMIFPASILLYTVVYGIFLIIASLSLIRHIKASIQTVQNQ